MVHNSLTYMRLKHLRWQPGTSHLPLVAGLVAVAVLAGAGSGRADSLGEMQAFNSQHSMEQQLAAAMMGANQGQQAISAGQQQQQHSNGQPQTQSHNQNQHQLVTGNSEVASTSRARSPRSIGDMFKKLFNANKRSKSPTGSREWDQLQQQQQQHQQAFQSHMAANLAAAAANQHAVYASPFAAYAPSYTSLANPYSGAGLMAWPASSLAQAMRGTPSLLTPAGSAVSLANAGGAAGSLYAAASQPYTAYAAPPPQSQAASSLVGMPQQPVAAASQQHVSAVPAPGSPQAGSLDFHQVLDALVRTSGFAPAGDQEAAAAQGYASKEGTPVFSFKKLVSLPFYLSSEEKSLDSLAASGQPGFSFHSMPIMRRHVRRMSSPAQHQHQLQLTNLAASFQTDPSSRSEREQQLRYSTYFNALNNQLASMTANNQLMQYLTRQQNQPSVASQVEAFAADAALANYHASQQQPQQQSPFKSARSNQAAQQQMVAAASTLVPMAVAAPQSMSKEAGELQALLSSIQMQGSPTDSFYGSPASDRYAVQPVSQYYWPRASALSDGASAFAINSNGNVLNNGHRDYMTLMGHSMQPTSSMGNLLTSQQVQQLQNNAMEQQQQQQQLPIVTASGVTQSQMQPSSPAQQVVEQQQQQQSVSIPQQQQSAMNTQSQQQQQSLVPLGAQRDGTSSNPNGGFTQSGSQIEGQQK